MAFLAFRYAHYDTHTNAYIMYTTAVQGDSIVIYKPVIIFLYECPHLNLNFVDFQSLYRISRHRRVVSTREAVWAADSPQTLWRFVWFFHTIKVGGRPTS